MEGCSTGQPAGSLTDQKLVPSPSVLRCTFRDLPDNLACSDPKENESCLQQLNCLGTPLELILPESSTVLLALGGEGAMQQIVPVA